MNRLGPPNAKRILGKGDNGVILDHYADADTMIRQALGISGNVDSAAISATYDILRQLHPDAARYGVLLIADGTPGCSGFAEVTNATLDKAKALLTAHDPARTGESMIQVRAAAERIRAEGGIFAGIGMIGISPPECRAQWGHAPLYAADESELPLLARRTMAALLPLFSKA